MPQSAKDERFARRLALRMQKQSQDAERRNAVISRQAVQIAAVACAGFGSTDYPATLLEMAAMIGRRRQTCSSDAPDIEKARRIAARGVGYKEFAQHYAENDGS